METNSQEKPPSGLPTLEPLSVITCFLLITCTVSMSLTAQVYKWVDENGKTYYSDKPLGEKSEIVEIQNTPAPDPERDARIEKRTRLLRILEEDRQDAKQNKAEKATEKRSRKSNCIRARKTLQEIKNARFLYENSDDPRNPAIYSAEARAEATREAEAMVRHWCQ